MTQPTNAVRTVSALRATVSKWRADGARIALVPTMGALHAGHLSLVEIARKEADRVIASIFVNPTQFGPREDFAKYPRDEAGDLAKLDSAGTDLVYAPNREEMYPAGFETKVSVPTLSHDLCGRMRPGHFDGVATVVAKLLLQASPDIAVFGEKDYQQLLVIKRLVTDLDLPVRILPGPIVREADGLALSSRNVYLAPEERRVASLLFQTLSEVADALVKGEDPRAAEAAGRSKLEANGFRVDYVAARDAETLAPLPGPLRGAARVLGAVHLGRTRLIDNVAVTPGV